jgi:hypothetical protein
MLTPDDIERLEATPFARVHDEIPDNLAGPQCTAICSFMPSRLSYNICVPGRAEDMQPAEVQCTAVCSIPALSIIQSYGRCLPN